jgi:ubiquitin carboxyl-terminal hydrolase 4/11/15
MNSSIACLSNCTELTYYFLEGDYKKDINEENTLGMRGDLAKSWGELLHQYWVEGTRVGDPSDFKYTIGRKAVRFRGYGQQDSHEFMSIFLDYLNEDLNRIAKKEYIEMKEKGENENDVDCAKRFWDCNLKRNDSIITDLFCGQYKSTITCPKCGFINITFDPFNTVNVPLLTQPKRRSNFYNSPEKIDFKFYYIPKYCLRNPIMVKVKQIEDSQIFLYLIDRIKKEKDCILHDKLNEIYMIDMFQQKVFSIPQFSDEIKRYNFSNEFVVSFPYNRKEDN